MKQLTIHNRVKVLKSMHCIMEFMNDERAYYNWVVEGVPDCPSEEDYISMAEDDEMFNDSVVWFEKVLHYYIEGGIYCGN